MEYDVLVLGRGIAGSVLAETCRLRGLSVHVFDHKQPGNATLAAGGAVNPVVLRRHGLCWGASMLMPAADAFFSAWDRRSGQTRWHGASLVQLFADAGEAARWEQAMARPELASVLRSVPEPEIDEGPFRAPYGYGTVAGAGWLDIPMLLEAQRGALLQEGGLTERLVGEAEVREEPDGMRIGALKGRWLVDCTGPFAPSGSLVPVKGESLTVRIPGLRLSRMVHGRVGLLPAGDDLFRVGSTFAWTDVWGGPGEAAQAWMLARLQDMLDRPVELVDHQAGVRPAARDRKPILGTTGRHRAMLNGMGARGVMQAPWCAAHLLDHLFLGRPLHPEVDASRFG